MEDFSIWETNPREAYRLWQAQEATGADRRPVYAEVKLTSMPKLH
jgi:hypothetical protein